jgi:ribonuclease HII
MTDSSSKPASAASIKAALAGLPHDEQPALLARYFDDPRPAVQKAVAAGVRRYEREEAERQRVRGMYALMAELGGEGVVVGVDEVGRGPLAGPLTVAAVVLPREPIVWGINDSKKLSPTRREELDREIRQTALAVGLYSVPPDQIDACGMAASLRFAMFHAVEACGVDPDCVLIDGNPVHAHPKERTVVQGDAQVACIAAASIVAKVHRDAYMVQMDAVYPGYGFAESKGYGSAAHMDAIRRLGLTPIHRRSFCRNVLAQA